MQSTNTFELARYGADLQRRMHDMPIGDPMAGAPYGEYLKSKGLGMIIGIVASVITMGAAAPLLASTVLATQIAGGVMMAGGVLSGVGAITGNKKLAKIGGIMSLAGGIGGLASGALNSAGAGGAFASGSGSEAVATMSSNFMDSASSMSGGLAYGDRVAGAGAEKIAGEFAQSNAGVAAEPAAAGTIKLADTPANTGSTDVGANLMGETPGGATGITAPAAPGDALKLSAGDPNGGIIKNELAKSGANDSMFSGANKFLGDNKELLKTGANALEMGVKYGMGGDAADAQMTEVLNRAEVYDAQAALLTTQNAQAQFQLANQNKKSVMISADDPQLDQKMAAAKAEGAAIGIIPSVGAGGVKQTPGAQFGNSAQMPAGQQVGRQATYSQPTAGILNKAA